MPLAVIKEEFKTKRVAFGKSAAFLGERDDIDDLAIMAQESKNPNLIRLFKVLPELSVLKKAKTESQLIRPKIQPQKTTSKTDKPKKQS